MLRSAVEQLIARRGWLVRGESIVASTGLALAVILLGAMATFAWWTLRAQSDVVAKAQHDQTRTVGALLAQSAETLLAAEELSAVRRLISDTPRFNNVRECRIVLGNGEVIADATTSKITAPKLPASWATDAEGVLEEAAINEAGLFEFPIEIAGRGSARLQMSLFSVQSNWQSWETQAGMGLIGAVGMLALLIIYRRMRGRLWAMGAIRESLLAKHDGEQSFAALAIDARSGPEAKAWDDHLQIKYANGAAAVLLRAKREEMIGSDVTTLAVDNSLIDPIRKVVDGTIRRRVTSEVKLEGDSGQGVLRFNVRPVRRGDTAAAMVIIEDITQQRLAEEARNLFVAQATHELRMPLTNIRLYTESALDEGERDVAVRSKCLNVINQESKRLERIVGDMLSVAEIEAGTLKLRTGDVRLETLFEELRADYQGQAAEREISLIFNLPPKLPAIKGDRDKIVLALHNLIGNAIKYTPPKGSVNVNVEVTENQLIVEVTDTGIGVSPEETELIFEKFYRSKDKRVAEISGTGLGLSVAREVIRLHRGDINVRSQLNQGSTFTMTVPILLEAA